MAQISDCCDTCGDSHYQQAASVCQVYMYINRLQVLISVEYCLMKGIYSQICSYIIAALIAKAFDVRLAWYSVGHHQFKMYSSTSCQFTVTALQVTVGEVTTIAA